MKSAIIVAETAEERRSIAQFLQPTGLFAHIHFCVSYKEVDFLLSNSQIDILFCDVHSQRKESLPFTARLMNIASKHRLQLVFFSHLDPVELTQLGVIPNGAHCLSYDSSPATALELLKRLLQQHPEETSALNERPVERLIDNGSGLYNRFYFDAILDQELSRSKLTGRPFSLLLIEPQLGENKLSLANLLPSVTLTIKTQIRTSDMLCRIEQKRLALLLPETTRLNAQRVINRIQGKVQELAEGAHLDLRFGLASPNVSNRFNRHGLLSEAEAALSPSC